LPVIERFECFQYFQKIKLGEVEKIDVVSGKNRVLEMTSRTKVVRLNIFFGVKKVDEDV